MTKTHFHHELMGRNGQKGKKSQGSTMGKERGGGRKFEEMAWYRMR